MLGIEPDVAAKPHLATFTSKRLLSLQAPDVRQMRPLHGLAKVASRQIELAESRHLPWELACLMFGVTRRSFHRPTMN
jgi:hypothetical protein